VLGAYFHEGWPYAVPGAWARPDVVRRLSEAAAGLPEGFSLAIWDAWRDPRLQAVLHDAVYAPGSTLAPGFVAYPDPDPRHCPPHASGGTLDLTLTYRNVPLSLGTTFDAFVPQAAAAALEPDGPVLERDLRRLLASAMTNVGFVQHPQEWWHWEFGTRFWAQVTGNPVRYGHAIRPGTDRAT
jgi:D-alanyl-D-alanine dipeptidase